MIDARLYPLRAVHGLVRIALVGAAVLIAASVAGFILAPQLQRAQTVNRELATTIAQAKQVANQWADAEECDTSPAVRYKVVCEKAQQVKDQPSPSPQDALAMIQAVTDAFLADLPAQVDAAVQDALRRNPPQVTLTQEELLATVTPVVESVVTAYLQEHSTTEPTPHVVVNTTRDEVEAYFERHPATPGPPGEPGPPPTDEQVRAAADAWFAAHPPNSCPGVWAHVLLPNGKFGYQCEEPG